MTIGVPVVAADRGALPEVSGDAALLVDPTDEEAMAEAMRGILEDPSTAQAGVERGYRRAAQYHVAGERGAAARGVSRRASSARGARA